MHQCHRVQHCSRTQRLTSNDVFMASSCGLNNNRSMMDDRATRAENRHHYCCQGFVTSTVDGFLDRTACRRAHGRCVIISLYLTIATIVSSGPGLLLYLANQFWERVASSIFPRVIFLESGSVESDN